MKFRHEESLLSSARGDPEEFYVSQVLPEKVALDLEYCRTRTARSDLRVLGATVGAVFRQRSGRGVSSERRRRWTRQGATATARQPIAGLTPPPTFTA